jgi:N-acetylmuramic acid 6-phosphate etherase
MRQAATEEKSDRYGSVETWEDRAILEAIVDGQAAAIAGCRSAIPSLARAAQLLAATWSAGGRIAYAGAGSSGTLALLDALELPGTYGMSDERLPVLIAGGDASLSRLDAQAEDDIEAAARDVRTARLGEGDAVIAVSASGSTPYTLEVARRARDNGAVVVGIACNASAPLLDLADVAVAIPTGPEIVAGSTRMNAGTAQKCALNMLSTLTAMRLHHVYDGMMVNVRAENTKLEARAAGIVARATGRDPETARRALDAADGSVKVAILVARGLDPVDAAQRIEVAGGNLHLALRAVGQSNAGDADHD